MQAPQLNETSLQNARRILNGMIESAVKEFDNVDIKCQEFKARNRETFEQINADLAIFSSDLAELGEQRAEHTEGSAEMDRQRAKTEGEIEETELAFKKENLRDEAEMTVRSNDLAVFDFILQLSSCEQSPQNCSTSLLLQQGSAGNICKRKLSVCNT